MTNIHAAATSRAKIVDLGDGLIMRWSTNADSKNVEELVGEAYKWMIFGPSPGPGETPGHNQLFKAGARRLLSGKCGTMSEFNYALVEDTKRKDGKNPIVACASIHRLRAYYGSIKLFFGKPELIATDIEYRNRGLVKRLMFEMIHPESEARGDALQFIPGIPNFYRQFGYEYALCTYGPRTIKDVNCLPSQPKDKIEPITLRRATAADIPYLIAKSTPEIVSPYTTVGLLYGPEYWQYTVHDFFDIKQSEHDVARDTFILVHEAIGKDVGFVVVSHVFGLKLEAFVLDRDIHLHDTLYSILRQVVAVRKAYLEAKKSRTTNPEEAKAINTTSFPMTLQIHSNHPAIVLLESLLAPAPSKPGNRLYVRISDYPQFVGLVTPELEKRLENSALAGLSGKLQLDFFRKVEGNKAKGLEMEFKEGKIAEVKDWAKPLPEQEVVDYLTLKAKGEADKIPTLYEATLAPLTFNNLLTGDRSLDDLIWSYGETYYSNDATKLLIDILFPKGTQHMDAFFW
ncbi:hypothetical protein EC991_010191 [Linnemannia zychae]|nr:hypothetical protein EC991_010191 [Linnemannia zychae]